MLQGVLAIDSDSDEDLLAATLINPPATGRLKLDDQAV
jgi:hypothetical protein